MREKKLIPLLLLLPFLCITALILISCANVLVQSFGYIPAFGLEHVTLRYYADALQSSGFLPSLGVSLRIALFSAAGATVLGVLLCAALVGRKAAGAALYLVRLPILVPHAVVAVFAISLFSQTGLLARLACALGLIQDSNAFPQLLFTAGSEGIIAGYLWKEIPFVAYFVLALMSSVSKTLGEAAENLGASPLRSFFLITLPLSLPAVNKAFLIIFLFAFGGYELPLLLGATLPKALPVQAYLVFSGPDLLQRPVAMAMNGVILLFCAAVTSLYGLLTRRLLRRMGGAA